jgi:hypothetical protein
MPLTIQTIQPGAAKANPFTICIVANPVVESPAGSGVLVTDALPSNPAAFQSAVQYIVDCVFGRMPNQAESTLGDPAITPGVRVISILEDGLAAVAVNSLIAEDNGMLAPQRTTIQSFLAVRGVGIVDVVFVVSQSGQGGAYTYPASDETTTGGVAFTMDGANWTHCYNTAVPGTIGLPATASSVTAAHELAHALGSYENGQIADLYVDWIPQPGLVINKKGGQPAGGPVPRRGLRPEFVSRNVDPEIVVSRATPR